MVKQRRMPLPKRGKCHPNRSPCGALRSLERRAPSHLIQAQKVWTFTLDVTDMEMVKDVCQAILKSVGQVHVLVNNAGLALGLTAYQDYEEWDLLTMLDTNVKGLMMVTRQILPSMVAANEGHIINMGSTAGIYAYAGAAVYSATKAAVKTFSDGLRIDTIATDIKVTTIQPGIVETDFSQVRFHGDK